jgi:hypothetical protein
MGVVITFRMVAFLTSNFLGETRLKLSSAVKIPTGVSFWVMTMRPKPSDAILFTVSRIVVDTAVATTSLFMISLTLLDNIGDLLRESTPGKAACRIYHFELAIIAVMKLSNPMRHIGRSVYDDAHPF